MIRKLSITLVCILAVCASFAQGYSWSESITTENPYEEKETDNWFISFQYGGSMAFGDDSYDIFKDFKNANGTAMSVSLGRKFNDIFSVRAKLRSLKLYSRTNLEFLEANKEEFPERFPRDGFYGYSGFALQGEGMLNLAHFVNPGNPQRHFNAYLLLGAGFNAFSSYDPHVEYWKRENNDKIHGAYPIDTDTHSMMCGVIGMQLEYKFNKYLGVNIEALGSVTGDMMEGVKYEEWYDVYVTYTAGVTVYF